MGIKGPPFAAGGNGNCFSHHGEQYGGSVCPSTLSVLNYFCPALKPQDLSILDN